VTITVPICKHVTHKNPSNRAQQHEQQSKIITKQAGDCVSKKTTLMFQFSLTNSLFSRFSSFSFLLTKITLVWTRQIAVYTTPWLHTWIPNERKAKEKVDGQCLRQLYGHRNHNTGSFSYDRQKKMEEHCHRMGCQNVRTSSSSSWL